MRKLIFSLFLLSLSTTIVSAQQYDLVLEGGRVMDPETGVDAVRNVGIRDGKVVRVSPEALSGRRVVHASGLVVAPGFIDLHQHGQHLTSQRVKALDGVTMALELKLGAVQPRLAGQIGYGDLMLPETGERFTKERFDLAIPTPQAKGRYSGSMPSIFQEDQFNANLDWRVGQSDFLTVKFFFANAPQTLILPSFRGTGPNVPGFGNDQVNNNRVVAIQHVHTFGSNLLNEVRAGYTFIRNNTFPQEPIKDSDVGIGRSTANQYPGLPLIRIAPAAGGVIIGTAATIDGRAAPTVATFADTVSLNQGRHFLRIGGEIRYNQINFNVPNTVRGQIDFQDFNSFLTGNTLVSTLGNGISNRNLRATDYNFFAQDEWKFMPGLTVSLGLRYELDLPIYDTRGRISTFDPTLYQPRLTVDSKGNPVGPPVGGFAQAGNVIAPYDLPDVPNVSKGLLKSSDLNNFAPRVGFAYSPRTRLVVRGGYGIFYSRPGFSVHFHLRARSADLRPWHPKRSAPRRPVFCGAATEPVSGRRSGNRACGNRAGSCHPHTLLAAVQRKRAA